MPTTLLHGESLEQAKHRRFQEEAAEHARPASTKTEMCVVPYEGLMLWVRLKTQNGARYIYSVETDDSLVNILPLLAEEAVADLLRLANADLDEAEELTEQDDDPVGVAYQASIDEQIDRMRERA